MRVTSSLNTDTPKSLFFEYMAQDESLLHFVQQFGTAGLVFLDRSSTNNMWMSDSFMQTLGYTSLEEIPAAIVEEIIRHSQQQESGSSGLCQLPKKNGEDLLPLSIQLKEVDGRDADCKYILLGYDRASEHVIEQAHWQRDYHRLIKTLNQYSFYVLKTDIEGNYTDANAYFCQRVGASYEEVMGKPSLTYIIPEDHQKCIKVVEECFREPNTPKRVILRKPLPHGGYFTNEWRFTLLTDAFGNPKEFLCIGHDISEQLEQVAELQQMRMIAQKSHNGVLIIDHESRVRWSNDSFYRLTQLRKQDLAEEGFLESFFGEEVKEFVEKSFTSITSTKMFSCCTKHGKDLWLSVDGFPLLNSLNKQDGLVFICSDITEQQQIAVSLRENQELLKGVTDNIPGIIMKYIRYPDESDAVLFASEGAEELWGFSPNQLLQDINPVWSNIHLDDRTELNKSIQQSAIENKPWVYDYRYHVTKDSIKWIRGRGIPQALEDGSTIWYTLALDITDQKEAEVARRETEKQYKNITDSIPGAVLRYHLDLQSSPFKDRLLFISKGVEQLWGVSMEEALEDVDKLWDRTLAEDKLKMKESIEKSYREHTHWDHVWRIRGAEGNIKWVNGKGQPNKQADGTVIWDTVVLDITDKMHATKEWERLAYIAEHSNDMLLTCDKDGVVTWANDMHEKVLGFAVKDIVGNNPLAFLKSTEKGREKVVELNKALTEQKPFQGIIELYKLDGSLSFINYHSTPIFENGEFLFSIVSKVEVTDLVEKQKQLETLLNKTVGQNSRFKEYSYITSHNIRSSVSRILGLVQLLSIEPNNEGYMNMLKESADKLDITITNINDLLHLEKGFQTVEKVEYNMTEAFYRTIELNRNFIQAVNADIELSIDKGVVIQTIPAYADSIMQNLFTNALKYGVTPLSNKIEISLRQEGSQAVYAIKDYGVGIDLEKHKDRLFRLGSRLHDISKGHGMGLFMLKRQIEALNGSIDVASKPYKGATFTVKF